MSVEIEVCNEALANLKRATDLAHELLEDQKNMRIQTWRHATITAYVELLEWCLQQGFEKESSADAFILALALHIKEKAQACVVS